MGLIHEIKAFALTIRESANDGSDFSNPDADYRVLFLGEDGFLHARDSAGAVTDPYDVSGGANVGNIWTMNKSSSQTLTNGAETQITFDTAVIDGGSSVIDLANDRFVAPATGLYLVFYAWMWEATAPSHSGYVTVKVGSTDSVTLGRIPVLNDAAVGTTKAVHGTGALSLTSGDFVTMYVHAGAVTGSTARGNASKHLSTTITLVRIT